MLLGHFPENPLEFPEAPSGSQFHPNLGLYSEPLYSYPQPPPAAASVYGTLPRPKPFPGKQFPGKQFRGKKPFPGKQPLKAYTARQIYEDNTEIMLKKSSTLRQQNSSDTSSLTRSNANRRRIRWSSQDSRNSLQFPENEETATEEDETSTTASSSALSSPSEGFPENKGCFPENQGRFPENKGKSFPEEEHPVPENKLEPGDSTAGGGRTTGNEESPPPPAIPPRRPPRPSREKSSSSYSRSATLELPSSRNFSWETSREFPGTTEDSDYENDPRSLPEVCVVYTGRQQQQQREGAVSRP